MCDDDDLSIEEKNLSPGREQRVLKFFPALGGKNLQNCKSNKVKRRKKIQHISIFLLKVHYFCVLVKSNIILEAHLRITDA